MRTLLRLLSVCLCLGSGTIATAQPKYVPPRIRAITETMLKTMPAEDAKVHRITARQFAEEIEKGASATAKYAGSWVEVEGLVRELTLEYMPGQNPGYFLILRLVHDPKVIKSIACWMAPGERPWEQASNGEKVTVRGVYVAMGDYVYLAEAKVVKPSKVTMLDATVDEMAKKFEPKPAVFNKTYSDRQVAITGKYVGQIAPPKADDKDPLNWVCIEGKKGCRLYAYVVSNRNQFAQIEVGEDVTVLGLLWHLTEEKRFEELDLSQGQNLTPFMKKAGGS